MGGLRRPGEEKAENNVLRAALAASEPSATASLLKTPGSSASGVDAAGAAAGKPRKARPSIKALQPDKPPPFTPVPGVSAAASSTAATTKPHAVCGALSSRAGVI